MYQRPVGDFTLPCDAAIAANTILMPSAVNPGNVKAATNQVACIIGVSLGATLNLGDAVAIRHDGIVQVIAGAAIVAGTNQFVCSDANGHAIPYALAGGHGILGTPLTSAAAGALVDVLLGIGVG